MNKKLNIKSNIIVSDPDILSGTPVFRGTRVPVQALFDYLRFSTVDEFQKGYPHISRSLTLRPCCGNINLNLFQKSNN